MDLHLIDTVSSSALLAEIYQHRDGWYAVRYYCRVEGGGKRELPDAVNLVNAMMAVLEDTDDDQMGLYGNEEDDTLGLTASGPLAESALGLLDSLTEARPVNFDYEDGVYYRSYAGQ